MVQETKAVYRVVKPHRVEGSEPLVVHQGERLVFERRETEWSGWIWCVSRSGRSGWVPERWVQIEGKVCVMRRDYDSTELPVNAGETFTATLVESGWAWGTTSDGRTGWVPLECLEEGNTD